MHRQLDARHVGFRLIRRWQHSPNFACMLLVCFADATIAHEKLQRANTRPKSHV